MNIIFVAPASLWAMPAPNQYILFFMDFKGFLRKAKENRDQAFFSLTLVVQFYNITPMI